MRSIIRIYLLAMPVLLFSCDGKKSNDYSEKPEENATFALEDIIGDWTSHSLQVDINSENAGQFNKKLIVAPENYEEKLQYKPSKMLIGADGRYEEIFRDLEDNIIYNAFGHWKFEKDSLFLYQQAPREGFFAYDIQISGDTMIQQSWIDWDEDRARDDFFNGKFIRRR